MSVSTTDPADRILNRYMSEASDAERQEARNNLGRLARLLVRIEDRLAHDWRTLQIRDSTEGAVNLTGAGCTAPVTIQP